MVATARRSGGGESIGGQLICRGSGFAQHAHQPPHVLAVHRVALLLEIDHPAPTAVKRMRGVLLVDHGRCQGRYRVS